MANRSSVNKLPGEIKSWLDKSLMEGNFSGYELLEAALKERGFQIGKSSIHRYGSKLERRLATVRAATESARIIAEGAADEKDDRSAAVIAMVQSDIFEAMLSFQEAEEEQDQGARLKLLAQAAKGIADVTRASVTQKKFANEIRKQTIEDAVTEVKKKAHDGTFQFDPEAVEYIAGALYGLKI
ncbi:DUF3486 family protein [Geobacter pelophilus]|uniref:DUF3486 family protein n=1 Tax=Geoanaerobacter pelophilus TaxID=60036 RepID=A0AAW4L9L6_9BACT|nr:DUF3486 family protein [Geoanaerobacter pelophilus]MBT0665753.1 DUF3486 family protein [Geoanaerobacter pelophilus]